MPTVAPLDLDGHVVAAAFLGDVPFFATATGAVHRLDHGQKVTEAHDGLLACIRDEANDTLISGGEDGKVLRIAADGTVTLLAEVPRKWISVVAAGPQGAVGFAEGRTARVRLSDGTIKEFSETRHMRMTGYPAKVKSLSWSVKGKWLASSGAPAAIVWPFSAKDGPMGKPPLELGTRADVMVTAVACHPGEDVVAIGYSDGMVLAARFADSREVLLRRPGKGAVTSMAWSRNGKLLAFGSEAGDCGVIDLAG